MHWSTPLLVSAWIAEKMWPGPTTTVTPKSALSKDQMLDNISI
ncbi:MAG: hypothetical protein R2695_05765 [Acidimicrobiales bacterium]